MEQEITIARDPGRALEPQRQVLPLLGRERLVELGQILQQGREIHAGEGGPSGAGLDACDPQQRIECGQHLLGIGDRLGGERAGVFAAVELGAKQLQLGAHPGQGRAQIMGDVVRNLTHARHQLLDALEHPIEIHGKRVEVVPAAVERDASGEVPGHDLAGGLVDRLQAPHDTRAHQPSAQQGQGRGDGQPPAERVEDQCTRSLQITHVAADQESQAAAQHEDLSACRMLFGAIRSTLAQAEAEPALRVGKSARPAIEVTGKRLEVVVDQKVNARADRIARDTLADHRGQAGEAAPPVLLGKPANLGLDGGRSLAVHIAGSGPIEEGHEDADRDAEQQYIENGQTESRAAQDVGCPGTQGRPRGLLDAHAPRIM